MGRHQLGFGWGKGRRVIKTIIAGETLTRALERQQRYVDELGDAHVHTSRELYDSLERAPGARWRPLNLRMAKADLRATR